MNVKTWRAMLETVVKFRGAKKPKSRSSWKVEIDKRTQHKRLQELARVSLGKDGGAEIVCSDFNQLEATATSDEYTPKAKDDSCCRSVCVDPRLLLDTLKKLPAGADVEAKVGMDGSKKASLDLTVPDARYSGSLVGAFSVDFETIPMPSRLTIVAKLSADHMRSIQHVTKAASTDDTRPTLCTVLMDAREDGKLVAVGTDTHRLTIVELMDGVKPRKNPLLIHGSWLKAALPLAIKKADGDVVLRANKIGTVVTASYSTEWGKACLATRPIEGQFPNYDRVIPPDDDVEGGVVVDTLSFKKAMETLKPVWREDANRLEFSIEDGMLLMSAEGYDGGTASMLIDAEVTGEHLDISMNAKYVLESLWGSDETRIRYVGRLNPAMIDSEGHLTIAMPMQK